MRWLVALVLLLGCSAGPRQQVAPPSGEPAAGGESPASPVREAAATEPVHDAVASQCARGDARIELSHLYVDIEVRILRAVGIPINGESGGFDRTWVRCDELASITSLEFGVVPSLRDLPPMPALAALTVVDVEDGDVSPLRAFPHLARLVLGPPEYEFVIDRRTSVRDLDPIGDLSELTELYLLNGSVEDIGFVRRLRALRVLDLRENRVHDIEPLRELPALENLRIGSNQVVDLSPLTGLDQLQQLDISSNPVATLEPLAHAPALAGILAQNTRITDLSALGTMPSLQSIFLCGAPVTEDRALNRAAEPERRRLEQRHVRVMIDFRGCHCC